MQVNFTRRSILFWVMAVAILGLALNTGRLVVSRLRATEVRLGGPIPYTVTLRETAYRRDGSTWIPADETWAVRSDGSTVTRIAHMGPDQGTERTIHFVSGAQVTINELANTKSTIAKVGNAAGWQRDPNSKCINSFAGQPMTSNAQTIVGEEMLAGYRAVKIELGNATFWYALDYGCAKIKSRMDFGGQGSSEHDLVSLSPGEPEAALFELPTTVREVPPSERILGSGKDRKDCPTDCAEALRRQDEIYYANRPKQ